jgi:DNA topoisomerase-1
MAAKRKSLVIVESPTKAKTINKYLGRDYQVEASMGHVRDLPRSKMGIDVQNDFEPQYVIPSKSRKTVGRLKKTAKGKEAIYLAPDPDREGEAISWHLASIFKGLGPKVKRVVFNEITQEAVKKAFEHPRDIDLNLVNAQQARRVVDRILGYTLSPLLWKKVGSGLSAGRVQSVALRMIVERENEIRAFKPQEYWTIEALLSSRRPEAREEKFLAKLDRIKGEKPEIRDAKAAGEIKSIVEKQEFKVDRIDERERRRKAAPPFTTSKLQQESYTKLGFTAAKTMQIAQHLYEGIDLGGKEGSVGLITYMRTDSVNIAPGALEDLRHFIREEYGEKYLPHAPHRYKSRKGAQEAHEAIRPSSVLRTPERIKHALGEDEFKLYQLIWRKFVACQMTEAVDQMTTVFILAGHDYQFKATGMRNLFPGFLLVYDVAEEEKPKDKAEEGAGKEEEAENLKLPKLVKGEPLDRHEILSVQHFTKPPARYNDASLVKILEEKGIGRPSTYAPTLHTLIARGYVQRRSGALHPAELGEIVTQLLVKHFPRILDYEFTAAMEEELDKVEEGKLEWKRAVRDFYEPFHVEMEDARELMRDLRQEVVETDHTCDICGKPMVIRIGRYGRFMACSGFPGCRYTKSIPTGYRCPAEGCNGDLVQRRSKSGRFFYGCSNYPNCRFITNKLPKGAEKGESTEGNGDTAPGAKAN